MHERIFQHLDQLKDLLHRILNHHHDLNTSQIEQIETIYRHTNKFELDFNQKQSLPADKFASYLNHDALSPVTIIIGYAEMLQLEYVGPLPTRHRETVERVCESGYALHEDLKTMLAYYLKQRDLMRTGA